MSLSSKPDRLLKIADDAIDGSLDAAQVAELESLLHDDPALQRLFVEALEVDARLRFELGGSATEDMQPPHRIHRDHRAGLRLPRHTGAWAAAAAIVVAFAGVMSMLVTKHVGVTHDPATIATLLNTHDAVFDTGPTPAPGTPIAAGFLRLKSGQATLAFTSGARVTLDGPCEFGLNSPMRGLLWRGSLRAYCPPSARGFTIGAPGCAVTDLGTRFRLDVDAAGRTGVVVDEGRVVVKSQTGTVKLGVCEAARIDPAGQVQRAFAGPVPLGTLFDDAPGTPLSAAIRTDVVGAAAHAGGLGVERVLKSDGSDQAEVAPDIHLVLAPLNWAAASAGRMPTNRSWSNTTPLETGLSTTGKARTLMSEPEAGIGMHANLLVTFDLAAIRAAGPIRPGAMMRFISDRAGEDDSGVWGGYSMELLAIVSDDRGILAAYANGEQVGCTRSGAAWRLQPPLPPALNEIGKFARFDVLLPPAAKYLTLVSVTTAPTVSNEHAVFSGARLVIPSSKFFSGETK